MKFKEFTSGLYYYDADKNKSSKKSVIDYPREIKGADDARRLYRNIGLPSEVHFRYILNNHLVRNCPLTDDDAKRAMKIYWPKEKALKGKMTKKKGTHAPSFGNRKQLQKCHIMR